MPLQIVSMGWIIKDSSLYLVSLNAAQVAGNSTQLVGTEPDPETETLPETTDQIYRRLMYDGLALIVTTWLVNLLSHPHFLQTYHIGMKCRVASCGLIYRKALKLSQLATVEATTGRLINMLSNDVNRFDQASQMTINLVTAPLQAAVVLLLLAHVYIGLYPTLTCLATIFVYVLIQSSLGRGFSKFRLLTARRSDERIRLVNELIMAIRIIKMYAWEEPFKRLVQAARRREMNMIAVSSVFKAINQTLFFISSKVIVFSSLITYILLGETLTPEVVFVSIGLSNVVRISLTLFFPNAIAYCAETMVSCRRINQFLTLPEQVNHSVNYKASSDSLGCRYALTFNKVNASWAATGEGREDLILRQLTISVKPKDLVLVVGRVGAGKSSFLMATLGELPILSGCLQVNGRLSYASQDAWIFPGSVRDNILFGRPYDSARYSQVLRVCSLLRDLEILVDGDLTLVGERGVSLSGGQKARVNLARALYHDADIYILDDPLSAVDAPVARDIFREAIQTFLKGKTVILATHQLQFLKQADKVLVLSRDSDNVYGTLDQVCESELFTTLNFALEAFSDAQSARENDQPGKRSESLDRMESPFSSQLDASTISSSKGSFSGIRGAKFDSSSQMSLAQQLTQSVGDNEKSRKSRVEQVTQISANFPSYVYYIGSASNALGLIWFATVNLVAQALYQYNDIFLSLWTDSVQRQELEGESFEAKTYVDSLGVKELVTVYSVLVVGCLLSAFLRSVSLFAGTLMASIRIHRKFFKSIINAPVKFFDFNPIGILLNRLSRDIGYVDETLPVTYADVIIIAVNVTGSIVVTIGVEPMNSIASIVLIILALLVRSYCSKMIIRLKQMEGVTGSPVFSHLSVSLGGLTTIRAFKSQDQFLRQFERYQNSNSAASFLYLCSARFLSFAIDVLSLAFVTVVVCTTLAVSLSSSSASAIGLVISQVIMLPGPIQWGLRQLVELESQMTSVQRIREYSDLEPEETDEQRTDSLLTSSQLFVPRERRGEIRLLELTLRYFPDEPPVLHKLSLTIRPGERVGIVGRTGAGKSSLISTLFRLYPFEGTVELDGRDTRQMSLRQLRSSISIIPQDPVLFGGSLRKNLDPFEEHPDEALWAALEAVQLRRLFDATPAGLSHLIQEAGSNLSVGQRQLICLSRAILRRNKVLILDEATANVDPETDAFIQQTIGGQFAGCTIITIAHRLITIADSDRVLVLEGGELAEFDSPARLAGQESSRFSRMIASLQPQQAGRVRAAISEAAARRAPRD